MPLPKKILFVVLFSLYIVSSGISQNKIGIIKYEQILYTKDTLSFGSSSKFHLLYKDNEINFVDLLQYETISAKTKERFKVKISSSEQISPEIYSYQNLTTKEILFNESFTPNVELSVVDKMTTISWKLLNKSKKIQNIQCFSAQAEYRGRVWTAWYAPSIPVSSGPWLLYGLPGMILEAEDQNKTVKFICEGVVIPSENVEVSEPKSNSSDGKFVNNKDLPKIVKEKLENTAKLMSDKSMTLSFGVSSIEIFDFEKDMAMPRIQQKLSDTTKK